MQQSAIADIRLSISSSLSEACETQLSELEVVDFDERYLMVLLVGKFSSNAPITSANVLLMDDVQTLGTRSLPDNDADQISDGVRRW